jgi:hypothetical protein
MITAVSIRSTLGGTREPTRKHREIKKAWNRDAVGLPRSLGSKFPSVLIACRFPFLGDEAVKEDEY